ncbi:MAG: ABC transporter permease subunit [Fuerstiella sp.]|nr:ABC transporter permease subunit [Fuerstiella sp.]
MSDRTNNLSEQLGMPHSDSENRFLFSVVQQIEFTRKELRETLRDRRTIVTLLVMPLLLYPLLGLGLRFLAFQQSTDSRLEYHLAVNTRTEAQWLRETLSTGDRVLTAASVTSEPRPEVQLLVPEDPAGFDLGSIVTDSAADLGVRIEFGESFTNGRQQARVQLLQNKSSSRSRDLYDYIARRLTAANIELIEGWAQEKGQKLPVPIEQSRVLLEPAQEPSTVLGLLPLILLLMTVTGGVYPAIDLTAGERERNTMETLMALPVLRFRLLAAKYVAVVTVTLLTGIINLVAMSVTLYALQLDKTLLGESGFTAALAAKLFLGLGAFAVFYAAVLLLLTSSARSFKEAQAYLIPLLLLSIAPGLVILIPGWKLAGGTAALPLVNILLLSRDFLEGTAQRLPAIVAVISTLLYGVSALALASQVFGNDAVAVGSQGRWGDFLRRPKLRTLLPSLTSTLLTLALLFPGHFIVSGILGRGEAQPTVRLTWSAITTTVLFVVVPCLLLGWQRVSRSHGLGLTKPAWSWWLAAPILGVAVWPWIFELVVFAQSIGIRGFDPEQIENIDSLLAGWKNVPLWVVVVCLGVVPGICEECFFRGFLFNGLKQHLRGVGTIFCSAFAFGMFHVILAGGAAPERVLPSTLMGILLGWVTWQSGSTIPSIIVHVIHNSTLLIVVQSRELLAKWNIGQVEAEHLPWCWLAVSAVVLTLGTALAWFPSRRVTSGASFGSSPTGK